MAARGITILGATGSIGRNTLDVLARHPGAYEVVALTANRNADGLFALCQEHRPAFAVLVESDAARQLAAQVQSAGLPTRVLSGAAALCEVVALPQVECVMAAIVGAAGLAPTLTAVQASKRVLLANKEALVVGGAWFMAALRESGAELIPIDSEHNAVFQCLPANYRAGQTPAGIARILLTASGGPLRKWPLEHLADVTPEQACAHPNWVMGRKISVDSATMMNKGLEVIEARWLFDLAPEQIEVVVHPQSVVHSLVEYVDGSVLAQLGSPDMRTPIAQALAYPARMSAGVTPLDLVATGQLDFAAPDLARFPCLAHAFAALRAGGAMPVVLNAANEIAVAAFLAGRLAFTGIAALLERALTHFSNVKAADLDAALAVDAEVRAWAEYAVEAGKA